MVENTPTVEEAISTPLPTETTDLSTLAAQAPAATTSSTTGYVIGAVLVLVLITGAFLFQVLKKSREA
jgi:hypothetical protein